MENTDSENKAFGAAAIMGLKVRALVEKQLLAELPHYKIENPNLKFDWSNSVNEGHQLQHPDGILASFSGILILDENDNVVADGWMEFMLEPDFFLAYWDHITTREGKKKLAEKQMPGIPKHVWKQIPEELKGKYNKNRLKG